MGGGQSLLQPYRPFFNKVLSTLSSQSAEFLLFCSLLETEWYGVPNFASFCIRDSFGLIFFFPEWHLFLQSWEAGAAQSSGELTLLVGNYLVLLRCCALWFMLFSFEICPLATLPLSEIEEGLHREFSACHGATDRDSLPWNGPQMLLPSKEWYMVNVFPIKQSEAL